MLLYQFLVYRTIQKISRTLSFIKMSKDVIMMIVFFQGGLDMNAFTCNACSRTTSLGQRGLV